MGLMEWSSALETSHPQIDEQHKSILAAYNQLHSAMEKGRGPGEVRRTLMFLTSYTIQHFKMEAELMDQERFPDAERHKKLHHGLVVQLSELMKDFDEGTGAVPTATMEFLSAWLVEHIQGEDCRLAEYLRGRGYRPTS